ncbi:SRPBCC family protein [Belliella sp. DSM 111904]|uniref:SRPBCC family protein n=1 Tax=Belliella filtrata TaxID=2923435 RepID=A0ABS9UYZ3_9BACT|nr:SRPBCC family protein [Belliella filtrata]MCH7409391.1 SRPBCC family protein [Belliella filtrata]
MKVIKVLGIGLLILIITPLVVALFTKKEVKVTREIIINKSSAQVYDYIKFMKNHEKYSKWDTMDPQMKKEYSGTDGQVGFVYAWFSDKPDVGVGEQEILKMEENKRIDYALRFKEPFEASDFAFLELESLSGNQTKVIWGYNGRMNYPMNAMLWFMDMDKMIGDDFEVGLNNLKSILEN